MSEMWGGVLERSVVSRGMEHPMRVEWELLPATEQPGEFPEYVCIYCFQPALSGVANTHLGLDKNTS